MYFPVPAPPPNDTDTETTPRRGNIAKTKFDVHFVWLSPVLAIAAYLLLLLYFEYWPAGVVWLVLVGCYLTLVGVSLGVHSIPRLPRAWRILLFLFVFPVGTVGTCAIIGFQFPHALLTPPPWRWHEQEFGDHFAVLLPDDEEAWKKIAEVTAKSRLGAVKIANHSNGSTGAITWEFLAERAPGSQAILLWIEDGAPLKPPIPGLKESPSFNPRFGSREEVVTGRELTTAHYCSGGDLSFGHQRVYIEGKRACLLARGSKSRGPQGATAMMLDSLRIAAK